MPVSLTVRRARAFAEALFSTPEGAPPAERLDYLMAELSATLSAAGAQMRWVYTLALFAVTTLAPLFVLHLPGLGRLPVPLRVRALHAMESRGWSSAPVLLAKALLCVLWYEHPAVAHEVGIRELGARTPEGTAA
jgi:hypothetical protein